MSLTVDIDKRDDRGRTVLYRAAERGDAAEVERLLLAGADPNAKNADSKRALHVAKTVEVVRLLVEYGADIEAFDRFR
jgi:ankyrin repeat protein